MAAEMNRLATDQQNLLLVSRRRRRHRRRRFQRHSTSRLATRPAT